MKGWNTILPALLFFTLFSGVPTAILHAQAADEQGTFRLAQVYEQQGKWEDALRYYRDLYRQRPVNPGYFDGVRRCLTQLKRYGELIALITDRMTTARGDASLYVFRGSARHRNGEAARALADWDSAVALRPHDSQIYLQIAEEAVNNRLYEAAARYLLEGRTALVQPHMYVIELARVYAMDMHFEKAMDEYLAALESNPSMLYPVQQQISLFSELPEAMVVAVARARVAVEDHPSNTPLKRLLVWLHMESRSYDAAFEVTRDLDRATQAQGRELLLFAQRAWSDKSTVAALRAYREIIDRYPSAAFRQEAEFGVAQCTEALTASPDLPRELAPEEAASCTWERTLALYEELATRYADQAVGIESRYRIAVIRFTRLRDSDGALAGLERIAALRRGTIGRADADILIGDIRLANGDLEAARKQYETTLALPQLTPPERGQVELAVAEIDFFTGAFDSSQARLEPLAEHSNSDVANDAIELLLLLQQYRSPSDEPLRLYARAMFLDRQDKAGEAAALLRKLVEEFSSAPLYEHAVYELGRMYRRCGQGTEAITLYTAFLEKNPESILRDRFLFCLAETYDEDLHDTGKALEYYQRVLTEHPDSIHTGRARERVVALRGAHS